MFRSWKALAFSLIVAVIVFVILGSAAVSQYFVPAMLLIVVVLGVINLVLKTLNERSKRRD